MMAMTRIKKVTVVRQKLRLCNTAGTLKIGGPANHIASIACFSGGGGVADTLPCQTGILSILPGVQAVDRPTYFPFAVLGTITCLVLILSQPYAWLAEAGIVTDT